MAKSAKIQTIIGDFDGFLKLSPAATMFSAPGQFSKLLGYKVKMKRHIKPGDGPQTADSHPSVPEYHSQKDGEIVNVFLDSDGNPNLSNIRGRLLGDKEIKGEERKRRVASMNEKFEQAQESVRLLDLQEAIDRRVECMVLNCVSCGEKDAAVGYRGDPRTEKGHIRIECNECDFVMDAKDMARNRLR
jgi:aspartate carbamoyltransferase regulatory subunit